MVYPDGEKDVESVALATHWAFSPTGALRHGKNVIEAEFRLDAYPDCRFWDGVGRLAETWALPHTLTRYEALDPVGKSHVLAVLQASATTPENKARAYWEYHMTIQSKQLANAYEELAALHAPVAELQLSRYLGRAYSPESDDGYRGASHYDAWFVACKLHVGGKVFAVSDQQELYAREVYGAETARRTLIKQRWQQITTDLACCVPEWPTQGEQILGLNEVAWTARYRTAWDMIAREYRRDRAVLATALLQKLLADHAWETFHRNSPQIDVPADVTALPPVITRDIGSQIVYGVTSLRSGTTWYRDEMEARAAHAAEVEQSAEMFEDKVTAVEQSTVGAALFEDSPFSKRLGTALTIIDKRRSMSDGTVTAEADSAPRATPSISDLKAKFNRLHGRR